MRDPSLIPGHHEIPEEEMGALREEVHAKLWGYTDHPQGPVYTKHYDSDKTRDVRHKAQRTSRRKNRGK